MASSGVVLEDGVHEFLDGLARRVPPGLPEPVWRAHGSRPINHDYILADERFRLELLDFTWRLGLFVEIPERLNK